MRIALIGLGMVAKTYGRAIAASDGAVSLEAVFARDEGEGLPRGLHGRSHRIAAGDPSRH